MTLFQEPIRALGSTPVHIKKEDLLDYFLYTFELTWNHDNHSNIRQMKEDYVREARQFQPNYENLELGQLWWFIVLIGLREVAKKEELLYTQSTIEHLLKKAHVLSEDKLFRYANEIHIPLYRDIPDALLMRYVEMERLSSDSLEKDPYARFFLPRRKEIVRVFKKHLNQKDLKAEYVEEYFSSDLKRLRKFSNFWDAFFDLFVYYFVTLYEFKAFDHPDDTVEFEVMDELLIAFLITALNEEEGKTMEALSEDLLDILYEFIEFRRKD